VTLGRTLRNARKQVGKTLRDIEGTTGISNGYLSQLESDHIKQPSPRHLYKLADVLRLDYEELMQLAGYVTPAGSISRHYPTGELSGLEGLTEEDKQKVKAYIQDLRAARQARKFSG